MGSSASSGSKPEEKVPSVVFHRLHGDNMQISGDWRVCKRLRNFDHAICFSNKPIKRNRYIDVRIKDVDPSWRGVLRFGVTTNHPGTLTRDSVPQFSCPGLQERDGFWVDSVPETMAAKGNEMYFYVTDNGDIMCGTTNNGKRQAFEEDLVVNGIPGGKDLWMVLDVYGQTIMVELFERSSALTVLQTKPAGKSTQKERSNKLVNRGREDPTVENTINVAIQQQKEKGPVEGPSNDPTSLYDHSAPENDTEHPLPAVPVANRMPSVSEAKASDGKDNATDKGDLQGQQQNDPSSGDDKGSAEEARGECSVCMDAVPDCVIYKCGHVCVCHSCADGLKNSTDSLCPVCREPIQDIIRKYET